MNTIQSLATVSLVLLASGTAHAHTVHHASEQTARQPDPLAGGGAGLQERRGRPMEVVDLPEPSVSITVEGEYRVIRSNSLPDHPIGEFPNPGNPNAPRALEREIRVPLHPQRAERPTRAAPEFGVALNGVIFDSGTGEFWTASGQRGRSAWNYDAASPNNQARFGVDFNHGHVQPTGKYHYHGVPTGLVESLADGHTHDDAHGHGDHVHDMIQIGWAFDGYPVYAPFGYKDPNDPDSGVVGLASSYRLKHGSRPGSPDGPGGVYDGTYAADYEYVAGLGDLDESNGRTGVTPEFPGGTYYYVITDAFPSVPRTWVGSPGPDVAGRPGGGGPRGMAQPGKDEGFGEPVPRP